MTIDIAIPAYNVADCIESTLDAIFAQDLPAGMNMRVYIADDGSTDDLRERLDERINTQLTYAVMNVNQGRSAACNAAAALGHGDVIIVLDADCRFADRHMISRMLAHFDDGADAVLGTVEASGRGFWGRYAEQVSSRRIDAAKRDGPWHMTTANFAVRRSVFEALGGFSTRYRHYGFEDRDFLIRLSRAEANVVVDSTIAVLHREPTSVREVCRKLYQSGRYTAAEFAARFPDEYRRSAYRRFDVLGHRRLSYAITPLLKLACPLSQAVSDALIRHRISTFVLQAFSLRVASGLSYLQGTCHAAISRPDGSAG